MNCEDFYMVWNPEGKAPTHRHAQQPLARSEAERLARNNPGQEFYVLAVVGMAKKADVSWFEPDEMPF